MNSLDVSSNTLFFAFKYALGRKSTAPSIVMTDISKNIDKINDIELSRYIEEIDRCEDFGLDTHKNTWLSLRSFLQRELDFRKTLPPKIEI